MAQHISQNTLRLPELANADATRIEPLDILGLLGTLWQGKWVIILATLLAVVLAGYYAFAIASPRYAATTTLHIDTSRSAFDDGAMSGMRSPVNLNTEVAIITSRHLLDQVIDQLDLQSDPTFNRYLTPVPPWSIGGLRTQIRNVLAGTEDVPPDAAAIRAKTVENLRGVIVTQTQRDNSVLAVTVTTKSAQTSARVANTLANLYLTDQVNAQFAITETAVTWLSSKVFELQVDLARQETEITDLITRVHVSDEAALDAINRQALETDTRLREARAALSKLDTGAAFVSANVVPSGNASLRLSTQIAALEVSQANLSTQMADQSAGLVELHQLRREADATRVLYETFLTRLQDISLQSGLNTPHSRVLNAAEPGQHVAPSKMLILAMAAFIGAAIGIAWAFARDIFRRGFRDAASLTNATGLPVMAQFPAKTRRNTAALDAARNLRTALLQTGGDEPTQTILCTASIAEEGQTEMAMLLANALTGLGKSVLLINGDLRSTKTTADLGAIIKGEQPLDAAIKPDPSWSIDVMSTTATTQHPADLFCSQPFNTFLNRLRENYDHIVIAAPPVLPTPDTLILAQHSDAVIYAVRSNKTTPADVLAGQRALAAVSASITGLAMTKADLRKQAPAPAWAISGQMTLRT